MNSDESIDLPLANGSQNRFTARGASRSHLINGANGVRIDLPLANGSQNRFIARGHRDHTSGTPRAHLVHTSAVTPCGHTVWTLFLPLLEPYSETLLGNKFFIENEGGPDPSYFRE